MELVHRRFNLVRVYVFHIARRINRIDARTLHQIYIGERSDDVWIYIFVDIKPNLLPFVRIEPF